MIRVQFIGMEDIGTSPLPLFGFNHGASGPFKQTVAAASRPILRESVNADRGADTKGVRASVRNNAAKDGNATLFHTARSA